MKIPTPKELEKRLQEIELIDPIVNDLTEQICKQLLVQFHTKTLKSFETIQLTIHVPCTNEVSQIRCFKDDVFEKLNSSFLAKGWIFTKHNVTVNNFTNYDENHKSEFCFNALCEAKADSMT